LTIALLDDVMFKLWWFRLSFVSLFIYSAEKQQQKKKNKFNSNVECQDEYAHNGEWWLTQGRQNIYCWAKSVNTNGGKISGVRLFSLWYDNFAVIKRWNIHWNKCVNRVKTSKIKLVFLRPLTKPGWDRIGSDRIGLDWQNLDRIGSDRTGPDSQNLDRVEVY